MTLHLVEPTERDRIDKYESAKKLQRATPYVIAPPPTEGIELRQLMVRIAWVGLVATLFVLAVMKGAR
jgi:hypothetical protein